MKLSAVSVIALALCTAAPLAQAQDQDAAIRACAESFVANHFAGQQTSVRVVSDPIYGPLVLRSQERAIKLVASSKTTGQVLAVATCSNKAGIVTVLPIEVAVVAAR